jgi:hypothetical protein
MILRRTITATVFLFLTLNCFSQADTLWSSRKVASSIKMALNGSLLYPGASLGIEFPVYNVELFRNARSQDIKSILKERLVSMNGSWYHHKDFHDNLYFTAKWIMRRRSKGGFFTEFTPGLGYSRTFLGGTTYKVEDNGKVDIIKLAGYNYAVITAGGGLGFDFSGSKGLPLSAYFDFNILTMFPYNSTLYFRPVIELGVICRPENFISRVIKSKKVVK